MQIIMPKLGLTMTHGTITEWLKAPGDQVKAEEALCAYETEKVTLELTAPEDGVLAAILAPAGTTVPAGTPVCEFETMDDGRRTMGARQGPEITRQESVTDSVQPSSFQLPASTSSLQPPTPIKATPLARRIAASKGIDLRSITGTGPEGMVIREDVEAAVRGQASGVGSQEPALAPASPAVELPASSFQSPVSQPGEQIIPLASLRRTIAERMTQSAFTAPHVTLMTEAEATNLVSARAQMNAELASAAPGASQASGASSLKISYNALLAALVARALREHPQLNARLDADGVHRLPEINIALAVDTERGLMTPVLRNVDTLGLPAIQRGYDDLTARALAGRSLPGDFDGGTFTITNLGSLDVNGFTPIINPPQAAILGVGRIIEKPVARDAAVVIRPMITLSLSFDHRIVDGAPAAKFLQRIKQLIERPMALLV